MNTIVRDEHECSPNLYCARPMAQTAEQLPRGRHRLSREQVAASQRRRMLAAMTAAVAEEGYVRTTVADVIAGAGVSRETFYQHFSDKEECFLAAFDAASERLLAQVAQRPPGAPPADPIARLDRLLAVYLSALAADPALSRVFLVEV